jgi:hypothetical protein
MSAARPCPARTADVIGGRHRHGAGENRHGREADEVVGHGGDDRDPHRRRRHHWTSPISSSAPEPSIGCADEHEPARRGRWRQQNIPEHIAYAVAHLDAYAQLASVGEQLEMQDAEEALAPTAGRTWMVVEMSTRGST